MKSAPFIDWITVRQYCAGAEPFPLFLSAINSRHSRDGVCLFEKPCSESLRGSWDSSIQLQSDGAMFLVSGNVGRFGRPDNVFNLQWRQTLETLERVCDAVSVPRFVVDRYLGNGTVAGARNARSVVSRLDITKNFRTGSDAQARACIRHLQSISLSRAKRGIAGDESVWWVNTRRMVKAYHKGVDLMASRPNHKGLPRDHPLVQWCFDNGIIRIEVELKNRLLYDENLQRLENISDEKLSKIYDRETEFLSKFDLSDEPDILAAIPARSRAYAAAWMAGQDVRSFVSRATLFRHAKVCRAYGIDLFQTRNIEVFPVKIRVIDLEQVEAPEWYEWHKKESA